MIKSYVNKNKYGYDIMGLIIDTENKTVKLYEPCQMPIGRYRKMSKKVIKEMYNEYLEMGYKEV